MPVWAKAHADAASVEADRRLAPDDDVDQRAAWDRDGYPDEKTARATVERMNELLRTVDTKRRGPIRRWLSAHGYPVGAENVIRVMPAGRL